MKVDLNCDLGEGFGTYRIGQDEQVLQFISSANIACGYHAGDHNIMNQTIRYAKKNHVSIGVHPGLQDLVGFGRRAMELDPYDVYNLMIYQMGALQGFAVVNGVSLHHVKPHGALYNMAATDMRIAEAISEAIYDFNPSLILYGLSKSKMIEAGRKLGLSVAEEVFADRTYQSDGSLTPRTKEGAIIVQKEKSAQQVIQMIKEKTVTSVNGDRVPIQADTICVHGDSEHALAFVQYLRLELEKNNIEIKSFGANN